MAKADKKFYVTAKVVKTYDNFHRVKTWYNSKTSFFSFPGIEFDQERCKQLAISAFSNYGTVVRKEDNVYYCRRRNTGEETIVTLKDMWQEPYIWEDEK